MKLYTTVTLPAIAGHHLNRVDRNAPAWRSNSAWCKIIQGNSGKCTFPLTVSKSARDQGFSTKTKIIFKNNHYQWNKHHNNWTMVNVSD